MVQKRQKTAKTCFFDLFLFCLQSREYFGVSEPSRCEPDRGLSRGGHGVSGVRSRCWRQVRIRDDGKRAWSVHHRDVIHGVGTMFTKRFTQTRIDAFTVGPVVKEVGQRQRKIGHAPYKLSNWCNPDSANHKSKFLEACKCPLHSFEKLSAFR